MAKSFDVDLDPSEPSVRPEDLSGAAASAAQARLMEQISEAREGIINAQLEMTRRATAAIAAEAERVADAPRRLIVAEAERAIEARRRVIDAQIRTTIEAPRRALELQRRETDARIRVLRRKLILNGCLTRRADASRRHQPRRMIASRAPRRRAGSARRVSRAGPSRRSDPLEPPLVRHHRCKAVA